MAPAATQPSTAVGWRTRALAGPVGVAAGLAASTAWVALNNPHEAGHYPGCVYRGLTGFWCPGCGGLRAVYDLAHGDVAGAIGMNPLVVFVVLPVAIVFVGWWALSAGGARVPPVRFPAWAAWGTVVVLLAFWVLRNVPAFAPFLAP